MPIYEYSCGKCGAGFEALIRNDGDIPKKCPKCGSTKLAKALSAFAVTAGSTGGFKSEHCASCESARPSCTGGCPLSN